MTDEEMKQYARAFASKGGKARYKNLTSEALSEIGRAGAKARKEKLTPERRREIARAAVQARWAKKKAKENQ